MYAIVKAGGRQEKVTVGETITVDRIDQAAGATVTFPALLVVDGASVTSDAKVLSGVKVTGEVIDEVKGPKIDILRYMNKTGYRRRQGFRALQTRVKITAISGVTEGAEQWQVRRVSPRHVTVAIPIRNTSVSSALADKK